MLKELELKDEIATLIVSLIEENIPIHEDVMNDHVHKVVNIAKVRHLIAVGQKILLTSIIMVSII